MKRDSFVEGLVLPVGHTSQSFKFTLQVQIFSKNSSLSFNPLTANPTKWSNTLKQFVGFYQRVV